MGYTMSLDASCKVSRTEVRGYLQHTARDVDRANGVEVRHGNEDIDASRTSQNITRVLMPDGTYQPCTDSSQLVDALERRLSMVKRPLRKDAVVLRPVLLQLDPKWYRDNQDEDARRGSYNKMLRWAQDTYGRDNMIGFSVHLDESNPHLHILVTPVTDDGRLSQKDWYSGPAALREMHQELREHMRSEGFDVDLQRKKPGKHARRMSEREYKDYAELQRERQEREAAVRQREAAVERRERAIEAQEAAVAEMQAEYQADCKTALNGLQEATETQRGLAGVAVSYAMKLESWMRKHNMNKTADAMMQECNAMAQKSAGAVPGNLKFVRAAKDVKPHSVSDMVIRSSDGQSERGLER